MALIFAWSAAFLAWAGNGFPAAIFWLSLLLPPLLCTLGYSLRRHAFLILGFVGLVGLAMELALVGELIFGLGTLALALFSWDFAEFSRYPSFERKALARLKLRALGWSAGAIGSGLVLAVAASFLRFSLSFWVLLGGLVLLWLLIRLWLREMQKLYGAESKGKRSLSGPME